MSRNNAAPLTTPDCELCHQPGGTLLWQSARCRIVLVEDGSFPGFCRVIWTAHVREMTDLPPAEALWLMQVVLALETAVRKVCQPDKINLASFGNVVPHLHWHIIPRWTGDSHFPNPLWGQQQRDNTFPPPDWARLKPQLQATLAAPLAALTPDGTFA